MCSRTTGKECEKRELEAVGGHPLDDEESLQLKRATMLLQQERARDRPALEETGRRRYQALLQRQRRGLEAPVEPDLVADRRVRTLY